MISFNHFRLFEFLSDLGLEPEEKCLPYVIICSHRLTSIVGFEVLIIFFLTQELRSGISFGVVRVGL